MKKNILEEIPDENIEFAFLYLKQILTYENKIINKSREKLTFPRNTHSPLTYTRLYFTRGNKTCHIKIMRNLYLHVWC